MKKILLLIASEGFQPTEYSATKEVLEKAGFEVAVASNKSGIAQPSGEGLAVDVDITIEVANMDHYEGVFIIGGSGAMLHLNNEYSHALIRDAVVHNKVYGAICISPRILAKAGVLEGKKATGWDGDNGLPGILAAAGAKYIKKPVVVDKKLITASGPEASQKFGDAIVKILSN